MDRRTFVKLVPTSALATSSLIALNANALDTNCQDGKAPEKAAPKSVSRKVGDHKEYMKDIHNPPGSDPFGLDEQGKGIKGFRATGTGSNVKDRPDAKLKIRMKLSL